MRQKNIASLPSKLSQAAGDDENGCRGLFGGAAKAMLQHLVGGVEAAAEVAW